MKSLKVLMLNGSPHANGNTAVALREMEAVFKENGVDVETVVLGSGAAWPAAPVPRPASASLTME
mgnify:CR=1 FL=1